MPTKCKNCGKMIAQWWYLCDGPDGPGYRDWQHVDNWLYSCFDGLDVAEPVPQAFYAERSYLM